MESDVASPVNSDSLSQDKCPRLYQTELFEAAKRRNIIIRADTGTGKTLVAVLMIEWMAAQPKPVSQRHVLQAFLVPTRPLVYQQAATIRSGTGLRVREYTGDMQPEFWKIEKWHSELQDADVIVCTAQIFYDILSKGFWTLEDVSLLVFDEAHHCRKSHVYNQIMQEHYQRLVQDPNERRVPKILGLTASPIWDCKSLSRAEKDIRALQRDLWAQLYEIRDSREDLERYNTKPKERVVHYATVTHTDELTKSYWAQVLRFVDSHADNKFSNSSQSIQEDLGEYAHLLFCSDWLSSLLSPSIPKVAQSSRLLDPDYKRQIEETIKTLDSLVDADDVPSTQTTPKFQALIHILLEYKAANYANDFCGMVFVERRSHAQLLHRMIARCGALKGFIKSGALTGHSSTYASAGAHDGMDAKAQNRTVEQFRTGHINLAIATNVAEEGLDFRACRVVIRFDDVLTWKGYIQSRGRARAANSELVVMLPQSASNKYSQFIGKEAKLHEEVYCRSDAEEISDAEIQLTPRLINSLGEGKDAILTYAAAVCLLNDVCQVLPHDEYAEFPKPKFDEILRSDGFVCRVKLPFMPALPPGDRIFESDPCPNKKVAKRSACFKACQMLQAAGILNEHFMIPRTRPEALMTDADGRALPTSSTAEPETAIFPNPYGDVHTSDIWLHKLSFDLGEPTLTSFGILCGQKLVLPPGMALYDHFQGGKPLPLHIEDAVKMSWCPEERSANIAKLQAFTRMGIQATINRRSYEGDLPFFLVVLLPDTMDIDWKLVENPLARIWTFNDLLKYSDIIVPLRFLHYRVFTLHSACPNLTADSKIDDVPSHPNLDRFVKLASKFKSLGHFYSVMSDSLRGELRSPLVFLESSFLAQDNLSKTPIVKSFEPFRILLPLTACTGSCLPGPFWRIFSFLPALTRRIQDAIQVKAVLERLDVPHVRADLATEALTPPGLGLPWDYQTLETVGDAFLKLATSIHVYLSHAKKGEGSMSMLRSKSVDNAYLRSKSRQAGLSSYFLASRYRGGTDQFGTKVMDEGQVLPDGRFQRKIAPRVHSDIVEALLGAGYISSGIETALKIGTGLDLCFGGSTPWFQRPYESVLRGPYADSGNRLQERHLVLQDVIGYQFKEALLLIQALTHRSAESTLTNCYEREEWLGDAIVDMWITEHCYRRFVNPTNAQLTFVRASLVANASLGYLALKKLELHKNIIHNASLFERDCQEALKEIASFPDVGSFYKDPTNSFVLFDPPKILGDVLEAIVGAIFIDSGMDLKVAYKSLDLIYEDALLHVKQAEPRDPLSLLLKLHDKYSCSKLKRVTQHIIEKSGTIDQESYRMCEVRLHDQIIATGRHPTSSAVAEQRACRNAYKILHQEVHGEDDTDRPNPWSICTCKDG